MKESCKNEHTRNHESLSKLAELRQIPEGSAIYVEGDNISKVLFGIDAGTSELLLAKQLGYDAIVAHHPQGESAIVNFHQVFRGHIAGDSVGINPFINELENMELVVEKLGIVPRLKMSAIFSPRVSATHLFQSANGFHFGRI